MAAANLVGSRVLSDRTLTRSDFEALAHDLGREPTRYRKTGYVAARQAVEPEFVESRWNGKETHNTAQPFDWIVTNLAADQVPLRDAEGHLNVYVIKADRFHDLYTTTDKPTPEGTVYSPKMTVLALELPDGFDIVAPWGERQIAPAGFLLLNGDEVYGNNAETFRATYAVEAGE